MVPTFIEEAEDEVDYVVNHVANMFANLARGAFLFYCVMILGSIGSLLLIILGIIADAA